jgi:hypothetical protein
MKPTEPLDSSVKKALTPGARRVETSRLQPVLTSSAVSMFLYSITSPDPRSNLTVAGQVLQYISGEAKGVASPPFSGFSVTVWLSQRPVQCGARIQSHPSEVQGPPRTSSLRCVHPLSDDASLTVARAGKVEKVSLPTSRRCPAVNRQPLGSRLSQEISN